MIEDNNKTREQLLAELSALRRENTRLRGLEAEPAKTAEALQESEEKFRLLFENMTEGVALHEMIRDDKGEAVDYRILNVNSAFAQQTGISSERAHGAPAGELYGAGAPPYLKEYEELVSSGNPLFFETYFSPMKKYFSISAFRTKPDRFATVFLDITGRKQAEQAIKESEERYRIAIEGSIDGVVIVQNDLHAYVNQAFLDMFGYATLDEIVGKHRFCTIHPDDHEWVITNARARQKGDHVPSRYAFKGIRKDGTPIDIEVSANTISYKGEKAVLAYLRDVTDRKRAEGRIKASLKEKEVLLKEIHHRVKNNLQVISSLLNMQSRHVHNKSVGAFRESIDRIKSMTLIHDKLYRSENLSRIYLADYIADLSHELLRTYATDKRVELDLYVDPLSFDIDTAMPLGLIINELASNALKHAFTEKAGSKITIHLKSFGKEVILTVSDNGIGFPENLNFRDTPSLGMQLVVTLVEQLEGTIELNGIVGTEFRITFPAIGR